MAAPVALGARARPGWRRLAPSAPVWPGQAWSRRVDPGKGLGTRRLRWRRRGLREPPQHRAPRPSTVSAAASARRASEPPRYYRTVTRLIVGAVEQAEARLVSAWPATSSPSESPSTRSCRRSEPVRRGASSSRGFGDVGAVRRARRRRRARTADHILAHMAAATDRACCSLGHFDTVWPVGQLARQPLEETRRQAVRSRRATT